MEAFRRAAEQTLLEMPEDPESATELAAGALRRNGEPRLERLSLDVEIGEQRELVSLRLRDGRIVASCSCGQRHCVHFRFALLFSAGSAGAGGENTRRSSSRLERVLPELRPAEPKAAALGPRRALLAEALRDVVTAVVRSGVRSERVASIVETLSRVEEQAPAPFPLGLRRWLGRMRDALDSRDVVLVAQLLASASALAADLRGAGAPHGGRERLVSWLGASAANDALERVSDRVLLEVGREWVSGSERLQIERRYLVDLHSGEVFREEAVRREPSASVGSCPRLIGVALAEAEHGAPPRRMRLLQYTTTPGVDRGSWEQLAAWGQRDSDALAAAYQRAQLEFGALSEPFVLTVPRAFERGDAALLLDRGPALQLSGEDDPALLRRFEQLANQAPPCPLDASASGGPNGSPALVWVAGRLFDRNGRLMLKPLAAGILENDRMRHERL